MKPSFEHLSTTPTEHRALPLPAEIDRLRAVNAELVRLCKKALIRSAIVHPGFADELKDAIKKAAL